MSKLSSPSSRSLRVLVVGSQPIVLAGLRLLLESDPGICVVDDRHVLRVSKHRSPGAVTPDATGVSATEAADVVVLDTDGDAGLLAVVAPSIPSGTRLLVLSGTLDREALAAAFRHGATGAVRKQQVPGVLPKAVRAVYNGEIWLDQADMELLVTELSKHPERESPEQRRATLLTPREREVVALAGEGFRNIEIAKRLSISEVTVRNHLTSIYRKLKLTSRFQLAIYAFKYGLSKVPSTLKTSRSTPKRLGRDGTKRVS